jgi:hypothetical protein
MPSRRGCDLEKLLAARGNRGQAASDNFHIVGDGFKICLCYR